MNETEEMRNKLSHALNQLIYWSREVTNIKAEIDKAKQEPPNQEPTPSVKRMMETNEWKSAYANGPANVNPQALGRVFFSVVYNDAQPYPLDAWREVFSYCRLIGTNPDAMNHVALLLKKRYLKSNGKPNLRWWRPYHKGQEVPKEWL